METLRKWAPPHQVTNAPPQVILQERTNIGWLVHKGWFIRFDFQIELSLRFKEVTDVNQYFHWYDPQIYQKFTKWSC